MCGLCEQKWYVYKPPTECNVVGSKLCDNHTAKDKQSHLKYPIRMLNKTFLDALFNVVNDVTQPPWSELINSDRCQLISIEVIFMNAIKSAWPTTHDGMVTYERLSASDCR